MNLAKRITLSCGMLAGLTLALAVGSAASVMAHFDGVSGNNQNGEYTYPYYISMNGGPGRLMVCDDFYHGSAVGDTWLANVTPLASGDVSLTRWNDDAKYIQAAFLLEKMRPSNTAEWGNINWAIWEIFNPGVQSPTPPGTLGQQYWFDLAQNADLGNVRLDGVFILTPVNAHTTAGDQEFMYVTPEPGALLLVGSGILGIWSRLRRKA